MMWLPCGRRRDQVVNELLIDKRAPSTRMNRLLKPIIFPIPFELIRLRRSCEAQLYDTVKRSAYITFRF